MKKILIWAAAISIGIGLLTGTFVVGLFAGRALDQFSFAQPPAVEITTGPSHQEITPETEVDGVTPTKDPTSSSEAAALDVELLQEVLTLLKQDFYGELPGIEKLSYGAIRGMLMTLEDPYTSFISPDIADILREDTSGEFEGIGATVRMREDGYLEIVRPLPEHPAEMAGLKAGDLVLTVDEQSIVGLGLYEAISLIRGPADTKVELEIARPGEKDTFSLIVTRARIEMPIVEAEMLEEGFAYIKLTEFDANAGELVEKELRELLAQNPEGLIFDLRDNPGGLLSQSIRISDLFLDKGLAAIERDSQGEEQRFYTHDGDAGETILLVVLVNGGSASASEIVAGALQDRGRASLIGETTLGKGSVQMPHNLSDGSQLRVTIARWFTPNDNSIHGTGLTPDIEVTVPDDTPADEDPQLERAIEYLQER
ncbi:MAG: S41 family peptidase [Anaerolineae bacterium]|nr:S41 family peptidase [Anaerolineae bacterium]